MDCGGRQGADWHYRIMTDPIARIRATYDKVTAPHEHKAITVKQSDFIGQAGDLMSEYCLITIVDENGKKRWTAGRSCTPLVDDDWVKDVGELPVHIDDQNRHIAQFANACDDLAKAAQAMFGATRDHARSLDERRDDLDTELSNWFLAKTRLREAFPDTEGSVATGVAEPAKRDGSTKP